MAESVIFEAKRDSEFAEARVLFEEYAAALGVDLCFQNFAYELDHLREMYGPPDGCLLLARVNGKSIGCVGLRRFDSGVCEMKRLFVRPQFRGKRLGLKLAQQLVQEAREMGYSVMRLDTIRGYMDNAIVLYASLGFKEIPAYYENPIPDAIYMELTL